LVVVRDVSVVLGRQVRLVACYLSAEYAKAVVAVAYAGFAELVPDKSVLRGDQRPRGVGPGRGGGVRPAAPGRAHAGVGRLPGRPGGARARAEDGGPPAHYRPNGSLAARGPRPLSRGRHG